MKCDVSECKCDCISLSVCVSLCRWASGSV